MIWNEDWPDEKKQPTAVEVAELEKQLEEAQSDKKSLRIRPEWEAS